MPREPRGRLEAAGFKLVPGTSEKNRRYVPPGGGPTVSYRQAFKAARGETLEAAVHGGGFTPSGKPTGRSGKFQAEYRTYSQIREAARNGQLAGTVDIDGRYVSKRQEAALARSAFRPTVKGHYLAQATREGIEGQHPPHETFYSRLLSVLHAEDRRNEDGFRVDANGKVLGRNEGMNAAHGAKALLLVAMGRRDPDAEYAVGDTP